MSEMEAFKAPDPQENPVEAPDPGRKWKVWAGICAGAFLLLLAATCLVRRGSPVGGPEHIQQKVNAVAMDLIKSHWATMREAVDQVATDDGARTFFRANPGLAPRIPSEAAFVASARSWRRLLQPLPEALPDLQTRDLSYVKKEGGTEMGYRTLAGTRIFMRWSQEDQLVEMRIY